MKRRNLHGPAERTAVRGRRTLQGGGHFRNLGGGIERPHRPGANHQRGSSRIPAGDTCAGWQRSGAKLNARIRLSSGLVERAIPRQEIIEVEPGPHNIAQRKTGLFQGFFQIPQRLPELIGTRSGTQIWPQPAQQTMSNAVLFKDRANHTTVERDRGRPAGAESERLHAGNRMVIARGSSHPGDRPVNPAENPPHGFVGRRVGADRTENHQIGQCRIRILQRERQPAEHLHHPFPGQRFDCERKFRVGAGASIHY